MALRVPKAELPAELRENMIKQLGAVPEPVEVTYNNPKVAVASQEFSARVATWDAVDASLKTFAHMAVAAQVGCSWCLDVNYFLAQNQNLDLAKASQVPRWRESEVFTPLERDVLEYAEAMTNTPTTVTDELSASLLERLGPAALVELTVFIGFANMAAGVNTAHGITSQGYSDACEIPLAGARAVRRSVDGMTEDPFVAHRSLLFTVAYEMLGSAADAEDVLQESWLRWAGVDHSQVRDPRAYLVRVVTRQALNRLRTLSRSREDYVGEWLPEPLLTSPDVAEDVELAESVSIAMLTVLETLGPTERAVFVLREVFEMPYGEIAEAIGKSAATVRQIARRAREHVAARRPRVRVSRSEQQAVVERFLAALRTGQLQELMEVMAPDVVLIADGGGLAAAALAPVHGAELVARVLARASQSAFASTTVWLNGAPAGRIEVGGEPAAVSLVVEDGRVTRVYLVGNPRKLTRLDEPADLAR